MALKEIPQVGQVMTTQPCTVDAGAEVSYAHELMLKNKIRHLPVLEDGRPVGIMSEHDMSLIIGHYRADLREDSLIVRDFTASEAFSVDVSEPLDAVVLRMARKESSAVLVTDQGLLVGIFTTTDACRCYGELLQELNAAAPA